MNLRYQASELGNAWRASAVACANVLLVTKPVALTFARASAKIPKQIRATRSGPVFVLR